MSLNWRNNQNVDYFSPKFSYFNTGMVVLIDFIKISIKSTRNMLTIPTNTSIIEPILARFSTNDRLGFMGPTYVVGIWVVIYYGQVYLPIGFAWLCERW